MQAGPVRRGSSMVRGVTERGRFGAPRSRSGTIDRVSDSFSERMRRRWSARRDNDGRDPFGPGGAFGADGRGGAGGAGGSGGPGGPGGPGGDGPGNPFGDDPFGADAPPPPPVEPESTARARMLHERLTEFYAAGDVASVVQLADLMPEGPEAEPYRTYAAVLAAEAQADDARAAEIARGFMNRLAKDHPEWETARSLFGEVMVQALVMGTIPLAGNLPAAEEALTADADYFVHPSGMLLKFAEPEEQHPLLLVLHGEAGKAVRAAQAAVRQEKKGTPAGRADALCTLALAACAAGDITGARQSLAEAERVLPGRPRIAATRARVEASPAATLREQ